jgi:hypothetical protein
LPENVNDVGTATGGKVVKRNGFGMLFLHERLGGRGAVQLPPEQAAFRLSDSFYPNCMTFCPGEQELLVADSS